jgi:hypothetical protein
MASIPSLEFRPTRFPKDAKSIPVSALHHKRRRQLRIEKVGMQIESAGNGALGRCLRQSGKGKRAKAEKDLKDRKIQKSLKIRQPSQNGSNTSNVKIKFQARQPRQ